MAFKEKKTHVRLRKQKKIIIQEIEAKKKRKIIKSVRSQYNKVKECLTRTAGKRANRDMQNLKQTVRKLCI